MPKRSESLEEIEKLRENLQTIRGREGVIGYILRASESATIDLKDPSKTADYAVLSAEVLEEAAKLAKAFRTGEIVNMLLEGNNIKVLLLTMGDHYLNIFMEKNVNHDRLRKDLKLT